MLISEKLKFLKVPTSLEIEKLYNKSIFKIVFTNNLKLTGVELALIENLKIFDFCIIDNKSKIFNTNKIIVQMCRCSDLGDLWLLVSENFDDAKSKKFLFAIGHNNISKQTVFSICENI